MLRKHYWCWFSFLVGHNNVVVFIITLVIRSLCTAKNHNAGGKLYILSCPAILVS